MEPTQTSAAPSKWRDKTLNQRVTWIGKLIISLATFGFAFPNIMSE